MFVLVILVFVSVSMFYPYRSCVVWFLFCICLKRGFDINWFCSIFILFKWNSLVQFVFSLFFVIGFFFWYSIRHQRAHNGQLCMLLSLADGHQTKIQFRPQSLSYFFNLLWIFSYFRCVFLCVFLFLFKYECVALIKHFPRILPIQNWMRFASSFISIIFRPPFVNPIPWIVFLLKWSSFYIGGLGTTFRRFFFVTFVFYFFKDFLFFFSFVCLF